MSCDYQFQETRVHVKMLKEDYEVLAS